MNTPPPHSTLWNKLCFPIATLLALLRQRRIGELFTKTYRLWKRAGLIGTWRRLWWVGHWTLGYSRWVRQFDTLDENDRQAIRTHIGKLRHRARISIVMPTYNTPECWLRKAIESVLAQLYPDWELCIADDASPRPHVRSILEEYQQRDKRIRVMFREQNGHISAASNSAMELATGEFIALLDHDDELPEHALYMVAAAIEKWPDSNLIYSDEDKIDEQGRRFGPYFKPDWNPDLLTAQNTVSHLGVYRTDILRTVGGFREGVEGSQDWDVALRVTEHVPPSTIHHLPYVLYHWRAISGSTATGPEEKSYVAPASLRVVQDHLHRLGYQAVAEPAFSSFVRAHYTLPSPPPLVSLLLSGAAINGEIIRHTRYGAVEIIFHSGEAPDSSARFQHLEPKKSRAEWLNYAAASARGEILCIMDADCLPLENDWLEELASHAWRKEIGIAAPLLFDAEGRMRGAQTTLWDSEKGEEVAWSYYREFPTGERGHGGRAGLLQNLTILPPDCLVLRAAVFKEIGGLDAISFPDALFGFDLCLRLVQAGYRNLWTPYARLSVMADSPTSGSGASHPEESRLFRERWKTYFNHDPAHNPNLARGVEWPFPAFPPPIGKPWHTNP